MKTMEQIETIRKFNRFYANVLGKIDQEIYNQQFPLTEARVITEIHMQNGCTATEIRERLGIDRGYMSRILQRFEDESIIMKKQSTKDKRQYSLFLTEYGNQVYDQLVERARTGVGTMINGYSEQEVTKMVTAMETIESLLSNEKDTMNHISIRPHNSGDVGYIAYLHGRLYDNTYHFGKRFEYYVMKGLTDFMVDSDGGELWITEVNGEIAGSIAITKFNETTAQLRWFILDEAYQGLGIGNKLMRTAIEFCQRQNYNHVFLWTVSILDTARHLYEKYGFKLTEEKNNEEWTGTKLIEERWDLHL